MDIQQQVIGVLGRICAQHLKSMKHFLSSSLLLCRTIKPAATKTLAGKTAVNKRCINTFRYQQA
jgi:hypothetical protein